MRHREGGAVQTTPTSVPGRTRRRRLTSGRGFTLKPYGLSPTESSGSLRQGEHEQRATQGGVLRQVFVAANRAQACGALGESRRHADSGPAADTGVHADVLLTAVLVREHVTDDSGRR